MNNEQELLKSIEDDEWVSAKNKTELIKSLQKAANNTMLKDQKMDILISKQDLLALKSKAMKEGVSYQILATSIIHKYINGDLKENNVGEKQDAFSLKF